MKPICCQLKMSTLSSLLAVVDIFRGMVVSALLVGLFCGMSTVSVEKLPEERFPDQPTKRVDYYLNREIFVYCICIGITFCGVDILMALALDNILKKNLGKASLVWMNCALLGILVRSGFYAFLWKEEVYLCLDRLSNFTETVKATARILFLAAIAYEVVKVIQLICGVGSQMEFQGKDRSDRKKQGAPKRVVVGMIGGSKRWAD